MAHHSLGFEPDPNIRKTVLLGVVLRAEGIGPKLAATMGQKIAKSDDRVYVNRLWVLLEYPAIDRPELVPIGRSLPDDSRADTILGDFMKSLLEVDLVQGDRVPHNKVHQEPVELERREAIGGFIEEVNLLGAVLGCVHPSDLVP